MTQKKRRIGLVACCGAKLPSRAPASDLYQSQLFAKSKFFVEHTCHDWAVLSASHGLVHPHQELDPYDQTLSKMTAADRRGWASRAGVQLRETWNPDDVVFVVLAGKHYRGALDKLDCEVPLEGLGIGHQLQWLTAFRRYVELHEANSVVRLEMVLRQHATILGSLKALQKAIEPLTPTDHELTMASLLEDLEGELS